MPETLRIFRGEGDAPAVRVGMRLEKYRILRRLGEGGFATVYAAHDMIEDRRVALKFPQSGNLNDPHLFADMQREVRIMARLDHPGILRLKEARFVNRHFVMVFPLGEETLADRLRRRLSRINAVELIVQMISAVAYAHQQKILHRDIKPENFVLFPGPVIQLTDFGLARVQRGVHDVSASGTLGYMSPEQAMGRPNYRSDVFSLGLVIYRTLAGEVPEYPFESLPGFHKLRRGLSQEFVALIQKAIEPSPSKRFRDGVAMCNAMRKIRFPLTDRSLTIRDESGLQSVTLRRVA